MKLLEVAIARQAPEIEIYFMRIGGVFNKLEDPRTVTQLKLNRF